MAREKFDAIRISAENPEQKEVISNYIIDNFLDVGDHKEPLIHELKKNDFERQCIGEVKSALIKSFQKLGLGGIDVPDANIHIYDEADFEKLRDNPDSNGFYTSRHTYLRRTENRVDMVRVLSHEMVHLAAFSIKSMKTKLVGDEIEIETLESKTGFRFSGIPGDKKEGEKRKLVHLFFGINEAVTELTAMAVRSEIAFKELGMSRKDAEQVLGGIAYAGHVALLNMLIMHFRIHDPEVKKMRAEIDATEGEGQEALIAKYSDRLHQVTRDVTRQIIGDAIKGDYSFFKELESKVKGATKILAEMGTSAEDAAIAADKFGFNHIAQKIREKKFNELSYVFRI